MIPWLLAEIVAVFMILILIPPSSIIDQYATQLRENYSMVLKNYKDVKYNKFPAAGRSVFVNVPFINLVSILLTKKNVTFLHITRVEELKQSEEIMKIQFEDILKPVSNEKLKFVLMEGEPGIGKSTFAKELALRWAKQSDRLLNQYEIVILIQLRFEKYQRAKDITDFFVDFKNQNINMTELKMEVKKRKGEGILWILDGFDELPNHLRSNSIFIQLISGDIFPKSTVIVTSRPVASDPLVDYLHNHNSKRISLRGFDSDKSMEYASKYFNNKTIFAEFQAYYSSNLVIESMLYNPMNCYIVCTIFNDFIDTNSTQYPRTMTALYNHYVRVLLKRHLLDVRIITDINYKMPQQLIRKIDFDNDHPKLGSIWKNFSLLSLIAFDGVVKQEYIFGKELENITKLSMMDTIFNYFAIDDRDESSSFLHTTLQEYLAAVYLINNPEKYLAHSNKFHLSFKVVVTFYVGILKMIGKDTDIHVLDILQKNTTRSESVVNIGSLLIGCLYEDDSLIYKTDFFLKHDKFRLLGAPTNFDYYISGYLVAAHNITFIVFFHNIDQLKAFNKGLKALSTISGKIEINIYIKDNDDGQRDLELKELARIIPSHAAIKLQTGVLLGLDISEIISEFQSLQEVYLNSNNIPRSVSLLKLKKLKELKIAIDFPCENVFQTLKQLTAPGRPLRKLHVTNCGTQYSKILNLMNKESSLEELEIFDFIHYRHGTIMYIVSMNLPEETVAQIMIWHKVTNNLMIRNYQPFIYFLELSSTPPKKQLSSFTSFINVKMNKKWHYVNITVYSESGTSELRNFINAFDKCSLLMKKAPANRKKIGLDGNFTCVISLQKDTPEYLGGMCYSMEFYSAKKLIFRVLLISAIAAALNIVRCTGIYSFKCISILIIYFLYIISLTYIMYVKILTC